MADKETLEFVEADQVAECSNAHSFQAVESSSSSEPSSDFEDVGETTTPAEAAEAAARPSKPRSFRKKATRKSAVIFGLGSKITAEDAEITGARLPTALQVLRCMKYHLNDGGTRENRTKWESSN